MNTIKLSVLIPSLNVKAAYSFQKIIINELIQFQITVDDVHEDLNSISMTFTIQGTENAGNVEKIMDVYINEHTRIRYSMLIFSSQHDKKYPSSVRINKNGKKIVTKKQKKVMVL